MSSPIETESHAAMLAAYEATLEHFSQSAPVEADADQGGKVAPAQNASPLKVTTLNRDDSISPLSEVPPLPQVKGVEEVEVANISVPAEAELLAGPTELMPMGAPDDHNVVLDPALFDVPAPLYACPSPKSQAQAKRPMPPAMHRLNTNVSAISEHSAPGSIASSPETPLNMGYGLYSNLQGQDSYDDLSRFPSRTDLSTVGAKQGTDISASSEDDAVDGDHEGGVPAPKAKKSHARKQPKDHIKRARNAFILFRKHITDSGLIPASVETKHQNISVVAAKMWREAPQDVRHKFQEEARIEKEEHQRKYPNYRYQPVFRRTDIIRRRVRKDKTEEEKVEAVAEAMIKGKAGEALVEEVKEQVIKSAAASESEGEGSVKRRRRREDGELSKGALRAQRAQNRAKAMRQNLLGSSLLGGMMYHQQGYQGQGGHLLDPRMAPHGMPQHPGAQYHVAHHPGEYNMPVGYDIDGQPVLRSYHSSGYEHPHPHPHAQGHPHPNEQMYRLPPIQDAVTGGMWDSHDMQYPPPRMDNWPEDQYGHPHAQGQYTPEDEAAHQAGYFEGAEYYPDYEHQYRFPPLLDGSTVPMPQSAAPSMDMLPNGGGSASDSWNDGGMAAAHEAPSGHVFFNERLFDGAIGTAPLPGRRDEDEGLGAFHEAVAQANEAPGW